MTTTNLFLKDLKDFVDECIHQKWDNALAILVDLTLDLNHYQQSRDIIAHDPLLFWTHFKSIPLSILHSNRWLPVVLKCFRNACIHTHNALQYLGTNAINLLASQLNNTQPCTPLLIEAVSNTIVSSPDIAHQLFNLSQTSDIWLLRTLEVDFHRSMHLIKNLCTLSVPTRILIPIINEIIHHYNTTPTNTQPILHLVSCIIDTNRFIPVYAECHDVKTQAQLLFYFHSIAQSNTDLYTESVIDFFVSEFARLVNIAVNEQNLHNINSSMIELVWILEHVTLLGTQPKLLLHPTVQLLTWIHNTQPPSNSLKSSHTSPVSSNTSVVQCKKPLVLILAQLFANNIELQDYARECQCLPLLLSLCNYDDNQPFMREYAIYCLRNLLTGNVENQSLVKEIHAIDLTNETKTQLVQSSCTIDQVDQIRDRIMILDQQRS